MTQPRHSECWRSAKSCACVTARLPTTWLGLAHRSTSNREVELHRSAARWNMKSPRATWPENRRILKASACWCWCPTAYTTPKFVCLVSTSFWISSYTSPTRKDNWLLTNQPYIYFIVLSITNISQFITSDYKHMNQIRQKLPYPEIRFTLPYNSWTIHGTSKDAQWFTVTKLIQCMI